MSISLNNGAVRSYGFLLAGARPCLLSSLLEHQSGSFGHLPYVTGLEGHASIPANAMCGTGVAHCDLS